MDSSHFCSLTPFSLTEESHANENGHAAFLTSEQSSAEESIIVSMPTLAATCPDDVSSFSLDMRRLNIL